MGAAGELMPEAHAGSLRGSGACSLMVICRACCRSGHRPWTRILIPILRLISHMVSRLASLRTSGPALKPVRSRYLWSPTHRPPLQARLHPVRLLPQLRRLLLSHSTLNLDNQHRSTTAPGRPIHGIADRLSGCSHPPPYPSAISTCRDCASMPRSR